MGRCDVSVLRIGGQKGRLCRLSVGVDPGDAVAVDVEDAGDGFEGADGSVGGR